MVAAVKKLPTFIGYMDQRYAPLTADILNAINQAARDQAFLELTRNCVWPQIPEAISSPGSLGENHWWTILCLLVATRLICRILG
jgi:hypothetical protein